MKTINIIELVDGNIIKLTAFENLKPEYAKVKAMFRRLILETPPDGEDATETYIDTAFVDECYYDGKRYECLIVKSVDCN